MTNQEINPEDSHILTVESLQKQFESFEIKFFKTPEGKFMLFRLNLLTDMIKDPSNCELFSNNSNLANSLLVFPGVEASFEDVTQLLIDLKQIHDPVCHVLHPEIDKSKNE
jgi:hypothetical protein